MNDYLKEREIQRKREYHRKWRAEHPDSVKAAQLRYWLKKAAESGVEQPIRNRGSEALPADPGQAHGGN